MTRWSTLICGAILFLLGSAGGCAWPFRHHEPTMAMHREASAAQGVAAGCSLQPATMQQVAYAVPEDAPVGQSTAAEAAVPLPERILPGAAPPTTDLLQEDSASTTELPGAAYMSDDVLDAVGSRAELSVDQLVAEVQLRNPSLQAVSAAWRAAVERYPQMIALDDAMFTTMIGPSGLGMEDGGGWMVAASQKIPWSGKLTLRGNVAVAEAQAMKGDIGNTRLRLAEAATVAFYDYYLARRQADVNAATRKLLEQFREIARNKYQVGQASEQDVLEAEVELAALESQQTSYARDEQVAKARINTLLHRAADHPLPPPPATVRVPEVPPDVDALQQAALASRPDLFAQQARIQAEQANLALACREYYPDVNVVAKYDGFMPEEMRPQIGIDVNIPTRFARRDAAVCEATDRLRQRRAEYQDLLDQVRYEVQAAYERTTQSAQVVRLLEQRSLPAAQRNLDSAVANYTAGTLDFLRLLNAERQLNTQRELYYQAIADYHRRLAELERVVGATPVGTP
jgi:outer membrane protein, heavy metal efflux system